MEPNTAAPTAQDSRTETPPNLSQNTRSRWLLAASAGIGLYLLLAAIWYQTLWWKPLPPIVATLEWPLIRAAAICVVLVLAPSTRASRVRALWWFGAVVAECLIVSGLANFGHIRLPEVVSTLLSALAMTAALGGWLALRGRAGLTYLALIVPFIFGVTINANSFWIWLNGLPFGGAGWISRLAAPEYRNEYSYLTLAVFCMAFVVLGAWVAAGLQKADDRRVVAAAERKVLRAQQMATLPAAPVVGADGTRYAPVAAAPTTNPLAIAAMILGIVGTSVLAVIFGHIALHQIKRSGQGGRGMAITGVILGYIEIGLIVAWFIFLAVAIGQAS